MTAISNELLSLKDEDYKAFHAKLIPTVPEEKIIGVRTPVLRKFARSFAKTDRALAFLKELPHSYYEENNVHAFIIETFKDFDTVIAETEKFLPFIDNWATCDMFSPPAFKKDKDKLLSKIYEWIGSRNTYTVRYALKMLMTHYLDEDFKADYLEIAAAVKSEEYYINMMIAWFFATALAKQYDSAIPYITEYKLDKWVHNKTIQKAVESNRISPDTKQFLKSLKSK